jgi:dTDP-4-dehydrorhamnose reductase
VHVVPADQVDKSLLSTLILDAYGHTGITVEPRETGSPVDRTLRTVDEPRNERLWRDAGYPSIPRISEMVRDLAELGTSSSAGATS